MSASLDACGLCGAGAEVTNPLVQDDFYDDVRIHLHCLNSQAGREWQAERSAADPRYGRYLSLITVARPVECPSCGTADRISPKAFGMGAGQWEANCTSCHGHTVLVNGYRSATERDLLRRLQTSAHRFNLGRDVDGMEQELTALAEEAVAAGLSQPCECGGTHRLDAPPRCRECANVLLDSPFHVASGSPG